MPGERRAGREADTPDVPIACTLTPDAYRARLRTIAELTRDALRRVERDGDVLDLRYAATAAHRVRALVEQERACCAFLTFEVHEHADEVQVLVTVPPEARAAIAEVLQELTGQSR